MDNEARHYEIHGKVTGRQGRALHGARAIVWWQHIRERRELGDGRTLEDGRYHIKYRIPEGAAQPVLLMVEALSEHLDAPIRSRLTEAQPDLEIDLQAEPRDTSEWAVLLSAMGPLLDGLKVDELVENRTHQDISFLARK